MLRERRPATMLITQNNSIDIDGNMIASIKIKVKIDQTDKDKNNNKDEVGTYGVGKDTQEFELVEMFRLIRILSNKISIPETKGIPPHKHLNEEFMRDTNKFRR
jgi:hypothetical protein